MRLYTRNQIVIVALAAALLGVLGAVGLGYLRPGAASRDSARMDAELGGPGSSVVRADEDYPRPLPSTIPGDTGAPTAATVADGASAYTQDERENIDVYDRLNSGVVNITTEVVAINWFLEPVPQAGGTGSGSIIDARGYVLTNYHVVEGAYKVYVNLADGSRFEASVVGSDPENDLAVIKFTPPAGQRLTVIPYGDSSGLKVGQKVLAIGNPFGLERTLTRGIVSGLGRPVQQDKTTIIQDMIQTDASINPGNSGGPLLNARGELIGVNTMIYSPSGGSVGVGFAVPVNTAKRVVPELIRNGKVQRGWIDAEYVQIFAPLIDYMREQGSPLPVDTGLIVSSIKKGSNADRAGLRGGATPVRYYQSVFNVGGDIIVSVDGRPVASVADLYTALEDNKPGQTVRVEYYRGSKLMKTDVVLSERQSES